MVHTLVMLGKLAYTRWRECTLPSAWTSAHTHTYKGICNTYRFFTAITIRTRASVLCMRTLPVLLEIQCDCILNTSYTPSRVYYQSNVDLFKEVITYQHRSLAQVATPQAVIHGSAFHSRMLLFCLPAGQYACCYSSAANLLGTI